jgi:hypothetical protein
VQKSHFTGIAIVISVVVICGYSYDVYRTNKLLDLNVFEGQRLVGDAYHLDMYKLIRQAIKNNEIDKISEVLNEHISNQEKDIESRIVGSALNQAQLKTINKALKCDAPCSDSET